MRERTIDVHTADGTMETFFTHPEEGGPFPVVILYMDAPGIREELYDFARRIGTVGYYCALPDLYYRAGRIRLDRNTMTDADREAMRRRWQAMTNAMVVEDTRTLLGVLDGEPAASKGPAGTIGYCMSGQFVLSVAGHFPDRVRATISVHGVRHMTDREDSPHLLAPRFQGEVYCAYAEHDAHVPEGEVERLSEAFAASPARTRIEVHPGTDHGYIFPEREGIYVKDAAERTWERTFAIFDRQLRGIPR